MSRPIPDALASLALGEGAIIRGVHVVRSTLLGFRIGPDLLDAGEAEARLAGPEPRPAKPPAKPPAKAPAKPPAPPRPRKAISPRVEICFRCSGDGLGRRDRGVCPVCQGRGVSSIEPEGGWGSAPTPVIETALARAVVAYRATHKARARESLSALFAILLPLAPGSPAAREAAALGEARAG